METTAGDIQRWYCEAWCPTCGEFRLRHGDSYCNHPRRPGLHERCPSTKPQGFEYRDGGWLLQAKPEHGVRPWFWITTSFAGALCGWGVVKASPEYHRWPTPEGVAVRIDDLDGAHGWAEATTDLEASAMAFHRYLDVKEREQQSHQAEARHG